MDIRREKRFIITVIILVITIVWQFDYIHSQTETLKKKDSLLDEWQQELKELKNNS